MSLPGRRRRNRFTQSKTLRSRYLAALAIIVALGSAAEFTTFARSDIAFLLYAAGRVLDGARLYVDLVEINPPLIVAVNVPPVWLGRAFGASDVLLYRVLMVATLLASLALCNWLIRRTQLMGESLRRRLVLLLAIALFLVPGIDFGQREHLLLAFVLPYLILCAALVSGRDMPSLPAFAVGVLAGAGFALKPHFLLLWIALELYVRYQSGEWRWRQAPHPATAGLALFLALYGLAIAVFTPEYFGLVVSLGRAYGGYLRDPFINVLATAPGTTVCLVALLALAALVKRARHREVWTVLGFAVALGFLAGAAQQKGWTYHFYPATALAVVLLGFMALDVKRPLSSMAQQLYAAIALATIVTAVVWDSFLAVTRTSGTNPVQEAERAQLEELVTAVRQRAPGAGLYVLSYTIGSSFPLVNYSGARWASRFPHLWPIEAIYQDQLKAAAPLRYHTRDEMSAAERYFNDAVYEDLVRHRPELLLVLQHSRDTQVNGLRRLNYIGYFSRDPRIAAALGRYHFVEEVGQYRLYQLAHSEIAPTRVTSTQTASVSEPGLHDIVRHDVSGVRALWADRTFLIKAAMFLVVLSMALVGERRRTA